MDKLAAFEAQSEALNEQLKHMLRHFKKPFKKMHALATFGGGAGLTPDEVKILEQYMDNPYEAVLADETDCRTLKEILQKYLRLMDEDKLKLKQDKARKAEQDVEYILNRDALPRIQTRCLDLAYQKKELLVSPEMEEAKRSLSHFQEQLETLRTRKENLEVDERIKEGAADELREKIRSHKKTIQANITDFSDKQVQIQ